MSISTMSRDGESAAHLMTRDEAQRIAVNIAKLPDFLSAKAAGT
jgi:hypothetical protein